MHTVAIVVRGAVGGAAAQSQASAPFNVRIQEISSPATPDLQSFVIAQSNGKWVLIGGRTNSPTISYRRLWMNW
ncbi:MAG TPA: hypothetical protein VI756_01420 [Blastocatellia bacterium]